MLDIIYPTLDCGSKPILCLQTIPRFGVGVTLWENFEASPKYTQRIVRSLKIILISFLALTFCARDLNLEPSAPA